MNGSLGSSGNSIYNSSCGGFDDGSGRDCSVGGGGSNNGSSSGSSSSRGSSRRGSSPTPWWHEGLTEENSCTTKESSSVVANSVCAIAGESDCKFCCICGDLASGFHYGVSSCEACKAFFKRTVQGNVVYSCLATSGCEVTKDNRKTCQACRLQKCLAVGMMREGVRPDRTKGGRQRYMSVGSNGMLSLSTRFAGSISGSRRSSSFDEAIITASAVAATASVSASYLLPADERILQQLLKAEPPPVTVSLADYTDSATGLVKCELLLADIADSELLQTIWWARLVPGFESLALETQMQLLMSNWLALLGLQLAYRSAPFTGMLTFCSNFAMTVEELRSSGFGINEHHTSVANLSQRLTQLRISKREYVLVKALLLLNFEYSSAKDAAAADEETDCTRDKMQDLLWRVCAADAGQAEVHHRVGSLLGCLQHTGAIRWAARQFWSQLGLSGKVEMHQLFVEMLKPCDSWRSQHLLLPIHDKQQQHY